MNVLGGSSSFLATSNGAGNTLCNLDRIEVYSRNARAFILISGPSVHATPGVQYRLNLTERHWKYLPEIQFNPTHHPSHHR